MPLIFDYYISGVGSSDPPSSSSNIETRFSHSDQESASISGSSDRNDELTQSTSRETENVFNITQIFSSENDNTTRSFDVADSSYTMTPKHTREMNSSSSGKNDFTEEALTYSEAPSETTGKREEYLVISGLRVIFKLVDVNQIPVEKRLKITASFRRIQ